MTEVTFEIKGTGKKGGDNSLTEIKFTNIKIGNQETQVDDSEDDHKNAKDALSELLSNSAVEGSSNGGSSSTVGTNDVGSDNSKSGGSSHKRKSYKKEKKMKGGKRKSLRRHKHV